MVHSTKCPDRTTRWDRNSSKCVPCPLKPGHEVTPNCGYDDDGGRHTGHFKQCKAQTFNDGSRANCTPCATCPPGYITQRPCNTTVDTICEELRYQTTKAPFTKDKLSTPSPTRFSRTSTIQTNQASTPSLYETTRTIVTQRLNPPPSIHSAQWAVPLAVIVAFITLGALSFFYIKRKKGQGSVIRYSKRSSYLNGGFSPLFAPPANGDLEDVLSPEILSAPLQTVLDNLDVLEELVILLDPECHGVKNTKHLASLCSFPSTWINYAYSMKESKSPLKAVLEGVTSRNPEWTMGHLVKLLRQMERNDAIAVLGKLRLSDYNV